MVRVYCICRRPYDGRMMLQCEHCTEWFHLDCLHITEVDARQPDFIYECATCIEVMQRNNNTAEIENNMQLNRVADSDGEETAIDNEIEQDIDDENYETSDEEEKKTTKKRNHMKVNNICITEQLTKKRGFVKKNGSDLVCQTTLNDAETRNKVKEGLASVLVDYGKLESIDESEIRLLCDAIEQAMYEKLAEPLSSSSSRLENGKTIEMNFGLHAGSRYKSKYRSLQFNLKDSKHKVLRERLFQGDITPEGLVEMSPGELMTFLTKDKKIKTFNGINQNLGNNIKNESVKDIWEEKENDATLLFESSPVLVRKTHKGEEVIRPGTFNDVIPSMEDGDMLTSYVRTSTINTTATATATTTATNNRESIAHNHLEAPLNVLGKYVIFPGVHDPFLVQLKELYRQTNLATPDYLDAVILPETLYIAGRIPIERAIKYLHEVQNTPNSRLMVLFKVSNKEDKCEELDKLINYLKEHERWAVISIPPPITGSLIKDAYLAPIEDETVLKRLFIDDPHNLGFPIEEYYPPLMALIVVVGISRR